MPSKNRATVEDHADTIGSPNAKEPIMVYNVPLCLSHAFVVSVND